jgi:hypothetical protein
VVVGAVAPLAATMPVLPDGVHLREVSIRADLDRIAQAVTVLVAEAGAGDEVVSAGWVRYMSGTGFATLWGGSTLAQWRRRGIYKALVVHRARLAAQRGFTYLQVDASDNSRPILEGVGFVPITTTTPYVFKPPSRT